MRPEMTMSLGAEPMPSRLRSVESETRITCVESRRCEG